MLRTVDVGVLCWSLTLVSAAYIDLTYPINENTLYWFKDKFVLEPLVRLTDPHWVATNKLSTAEHGGTHIDAPYHFNKDGWKLGQVPLNRLFMVEGVLINKTEEVLKDPEYQLTAKDIKDWEEENGALPSNCVVLVQFGWGNRYPDRVKYLGLKSDDDFDRHFPSLTGDAAEYLVESGKVFGIGSDTASPDSKGTPIVHKTVTKHNMFIMENMDLNNLDGVPPRGFKLVILPMRIEQGTGGPVHVVLITDDKKKEKEENTKEEIKEEIKEEKKEEKKME
ncbi:isatin hydrolase-like [Macrosteles quadrilineatus]|uniref:isatin hydrolase-like n=1 Tax=Macrosteles quadrilineatus TaxID=74068 RepID=UPI0023E15371|nr:isatin hydrolase-like [Macrosteles quadrilineatus]